MRTAVRNVAAALVAAGSAALATWTVDPPSSAGAAARSRPGRTAAPGGIAGAERFVEVRAGHETWQGLQMAQAPNLLLLLTQDGQLRRIELGDGIQTRTIEEPFDPTDAKGLSAALRKEFGPRFRILRTLHYVICHNTGDGFAQEAGELLEELYRSFTSYFAVRGMGFVRPQFPMVVLIFDDESEFRAYASRSPGSPSLSQVAGYYSLDTNRVAFFNAAGRETPKHADPRWHNLTIVIHEATHQIAFNSGCHHRLGDNPLWLVEGLAMYFEAPAQQGKRLVWKEAGSLNTPRLERFKSFRSRGRPADSLQSLVSVDGRFRSDEAAHEAYAESWALVYFLINTRSRQFNTYLRSVASKPPLREVTAEERLRDFQAAFGADLRRLDSSFLSYIETAGRAD